MRTRLLLFAMGWHALIFGQTWVPIYPGSSLVPPDTDTATFHLRSLDSPHRILSFYENQLKSIGFRVSAGVGTEGGWVKAEDKAKKRSSVSVFTAASSEGTEILITLCCAPDGPTEDQVVNLLGKPSEEYGCENGSTISSAFAGVVAPLCALVRTFQAEGQTIAKVARYELLGAAFRPFWSDAPALYLSYAKIGEGTFLFLGSSVGTLKDLSAEVSKAVAETATNGPRVSASGPYIAPQQAQDAAPQQQAQQAPEAKHPKLERALGIIADAASQVSLTTVCPKIYRKPVVFMAANDVQWLQACNANGYMLFGIYMYTGPR